MTETYTYTFGCPACGGSWTFEQFASVAKDVFSSWDGEAECPLCHMVFSWVKPGTLQHKVWYDGAKRYKNGKCAHCKKAIDGKRVYCSVNCRQAAYYLRKKKRKEQQV